MDFMFNHLVNSRASDVFLSFDFGMHHIGIASGQRITETATPLKTLLAKRGIPVWSELDKIIAEWNPSGLVVGVPVDLNGNESWVAKAARKFIASLRKRYKINVYEANEQLTTKAAKERVYEAGGYKALQQEELDSIAAKLILEGWMANNKVLKFNAKEDHI
jgi:putative holliday junction resolvase